METSLMVNDYPEPPEVEEMTISGRIYITYEFEDDEIPVNWDAHDIEEYIRDNMYDLAKLEKTDFDVELDYNSKLMGGEENGE